MRWLTQEGAGHSALESGNPGKRGGRERKGKGKKAVSRKGGKALLDLFVGGSSEDLLVTILNKKKEKNWEIKGQRGKTTDYGREEGWEYFLPGLRVGCTAKRQTTMRGGF